MLKKITALALAFILCFALIACGKDDEPDKNPDGSGDNTLVIPGGNGDTELPVVDWPIG